MATNSLQPFEFGSHRASCVVFTTDKHYTVQTSRKVHGRFFERFFPGRATCRAPCLIARRHGVNLSKEVHKLSSMSVSSGNLCQSGENSRVVAIKTRQSFFPLLPSLRVSTDPMWVKRATCFSVKATRDFTHARQTTTFQTKFWAVGGTTLFG